MKRNSIILILLRMRYRAPPAEEVTRWFVGYLWTPYQFKSFFYL